MAAEIHLRLEMVLTVTADLIFSLAVDVLGELLALDQFQCQNNLQAAQQVDHGLRECGRLEVFRPWAKRSGILRLRPPKGRQP